MMENENTAKEGIFEDITLSEFVIRELPKQNKKCKIK